MQARYCDPMIGRCLSVDPVTAYDGGDMRYFNRYAYGFNNPYRFTDPDGRAPCDICDFIRSPHMFPKGDVVRAAGESLAALAAYGKGLATGDKNLQQAAVEGMRENVSASDGINAAVMAVSPRSGRAGIYEFPDAKSGNTPYVGQSGNLEGRLAAHERSGRLVPGTETTTEVSGGKTAREVAEHTRIQEITGGVPASKSDAVSNKVDPIGPNRRHLLEEGQ
jgi:hypothetical protein